MSEVDKEKLAVALRYPPSSEVKSVKIVYWGQSLEETQPLKSLYVNGIESSISIPISNQVGLQDMECIRKVMCSATVTASATAVSVNSSSSRTMTVENSFYDWAYSAVSNIMGLKLSRNDESNELAIIPIQLTVGTPEGCYHNKISFIPKNYSGVFWKLILQVPVEGGYKGGRFKVGNADNSATFYFQHQSDQLFYAAVFFSDHKHELQPIEHGNMVTLEYDVVWRPNPALVVSSISLPDFLVSRDLVKEALSSWSVQSMVQRILEKSSSALVGCSSATGPPGVSDDILVIPLEEHYHETYFNFSALRGNDRKMAHILQSIEFIDVHLAVISKDVEERKTPANGSCSPNSSYQIFQWIYSGISLPQFRKYNLDFKTQLAGDEKTSSNTSGDLRKFPCQMLVLQPRCQSILRCCDAQFDVILSYLESQIYLEENSRAIRRQMQPIACLGEVLEYCQIEPLKVWDVPAAKAAGRTRRLIKICQDLRAQKESSLLLKILGIDSFKPSMESQHPPITVYEGIRNELVARFIVDMVLFTGGWRVFGTLVTQLISPRRIQQQLHSFIAIVDVLVEYGCIDGAIDVARQISSTLQYSLSQDGQKNYRPPDLVAYVDSAIVLSKRAGARFSLENDVIPVFSLLTLIDQQIRLWNDLNNPRIKTTPCCHDMYEKALSLIAADFHRCIKMEIERMKCLVGKRVHFRDENRRAALKRFFWRLFQLEQVPLLADSTRLEWIVPIYSGLPKNQLENVIIDLIGMNVVKKYPSSHTALLNMGRSLLNRDYLLRGPPPVQLIVKLLKEFSFLTQENCAVSRQFVQIICQTDKWSPRNLILLFTAIFSSGIWNHRAKNVDMENAIVQSLTELMTSWIARLVDYKDEFKSDVLMEPDVRMNVSTCFIAYIQKAKGGHALRNDLFSSLLNNMSIQELSRLLWDIYQDDIKQDSSLKAFPTSLDLYRKLCLLLIDSSEISPAWAVSDWVNSNSASNRRLVETTVCCLLWLGDQHCNSVFTEMVLASSPDTTPNSVILKMIESDEILQLVYTLSHAKDCLRLLLKRRLSAITALLEAAERDWQMPNVSLPKKHRTVEKFLHSSEREIMYANFSNAEEANKFSGVLEKCGSDRGYTARVKEVIFQKVFEIVKVDSAKKSLSAQEILLISEEKNNLKKAISKIWSNFQSDEQSEADVETETPAKKRKKDFSDIE